jgi:Uma2 family endonuclease
MCTSNKMRTILVMLSIAVGVFAIGAIAGASGLLSREMTDVYSAVSPADISYAVSLNITYITRWTMSDTTVMTAAIVSPDSDGMPMADNTQQFRAIVTIKENLEALFRDRANVFVAGDLLWYPVEGRSDIRRAPDVLVAFGRPKGDRGSYRQWEEEGIAPQVVFEVLSPGNTAEELTEKQAFYEQYGVEEYYVYDPETGAMEGWLRQEGQLQPIAEIEGWVSPRLGVRFEQRGEEIPLWLPDGRPFVSFVELQAHLEQERQRAEAEAATRAAAQAREEEARRRAEEARQRAEAEAAARTEAEQRAEAEQQRAEAEAAARAAAQAREEEARRQAEAARPRAERLAARLRALGIDPESEMP